MSGVEWVRAAGMHHSGEYADAVVVPAGKRLVLLAGSCPLAPDGSTVAVGDVGGQAEACVATLRMALAAAGSGLADVVSTRVLVATTRQADLVTAWDAVRAAFGAHDPPSTLLGVTVLGYDDQLVEVEAVAALPG